MSRFEETDTGFLGYCECNRYCMTFVPLQLEPDRLNGSTAHVVNAPLASLSDSLTFFILLLLVQLFPCSAYASTVGMSSDVPRPTAVPVFC